jgi:hypothetical protein
VIAVVGSLATAAVANAYPPEWNSAAETGHQRQNHHGDLPPAARAPSPATGPAGAQTSLVVIV